MAKKNTGKKTHRTGRRPTPSVLSINICDAIIRDEVSKKVSLIGLFNTIKANTFPCVHPQLHVYAALTNGHGEYRAEVRFSNVEQNKAIAGMIGDVVFDNPLQVIEMNFVWQGLNFQKPGPYAVEVLCNDELIGSRKFIVMGPQENISPTSGTEVK